MTITYDKFLELLREGENQRIDFKIRCDAFASPNIAPKAELIKDICAFSNNGNVINYLIIGVSDDRNTFISVGNPHLKDETIQDYCKRNIFPPPKVQVIHKNWKTGRKDLIEKDFVILKIGPHKREPYRLLNDIIDYEKKVFVRRNDVWIRRGTTSDIATPEEIARLVSGQPAIENEQDIIRKNDREGFSRLSESGKIRIINTTLKAMLMFSSNLLPENEWIENRTRSSYYGGFSRYETYIKKINDKINIFSNAPCLDKLLKRDLIVQSHYFSLDYVTTDKFQKRLAGAGKKGYEIHRVSIIPILASLPRNRATSLLSYWEWTGYNLWFTISRKLRLSRKYSYEEISYISDVFFVDGILSVEDFYENICEILLKFNLKVPPLVNGK